ncbi:MAG: hypothetical protein WC349_03740 [Patescibacteria group bacterium]|jgi:very-short-patch-repair endonuclease
MDKTTPQSRELYEALLARGIKCELEKWDGYKHIDISIPWAKIDIEVDGLQHFLDSEQIKSDFKRSYWSITNDDYDTIHIPNIIIEKYLDKVADAIAKVARDNYYDMKDNNFDLFLIIKRLIKKIQGKKN